MKKITIEISLSDKTLSELNYVGEEKNQSSHDVALEILTEYLQREVKILRSES